MAENEIKRMIGLFEAVLPTYRTLASEPEDDGYIVVTPSESNFKYVGYNEIASSVLTLVIELRTLNNFLNLKANIRSIIESNGYELIEDSEAADNGVYLARIRCRKSITY